MSKTARRVDYATPENAGSNDVVSQAKAPMRNLALVTPPSGGNREPIPQKCSTTGWLDRDRLATFPLTRLPNLSADQREAQRPALGICPTVSALEHIRRMRGGTQSQLMSCSDGGYYVVKFQNNPQGVKTLCNEMLAYHLAGKLGLAVPQMAKVNVSAQLVQSAGELVVQLKHGWIRCHPGSCFGSRQVGDDGSCSVPHSLTASDFLSEGQLRMVENVSDFAGMLVFDKWTCNTDDRQTVFVRRNEGPYRVFMIDDGFCFNSSAWTFPDGPLRGLYAWHVVYDTIRGFDAFEPWLDRLERGIDEVTLGRIAAEIPMEWYNGEVAAMDRLLSVLDRRRRTTRDMLWSASKSFSHAFRNWNHD
jgi:hypothetical protein